MSSFQPPIAGGGALPGSPATRNIPAQQKMDLLRILGSSYVEFGTEIAKGPQGDPVKLARAHAKITQAGAAMQGIQQPQQPQRPQGSSAGGAPRPVDRPVDALTQQPPADTTQTGVNQFRQG